MTINKVCGSGLKAVALADQAIRAGDKDCVIAGGIENMSQIPYALLKARDGLRLGDGKVTDLLVHDGLWDIYNNFHMGMTAEWVVENYDVSREDQDAYAARSHQRAVRRLGGRQVRRRGRAGGGAPAQEATRSSSTATRARAPTPPPRGMAKLRPAFKRDGGTVTAGNASSHQRRRGGAAGLQRGIRQGQRADRSAPTSRPPAPAPSSPRR